jgi:hypothetical protein
MAVPTRTETLNNFITATGQNRRPGLVDNFYGSAPLLARLRSKDATRLRGGSEIRENFIYANFTAGSYGRGDTFDTGTKEFSTAMVFNWKFSYGAINLDVIDIDLNDSPEQTFDIVEAAMENAELSLINDASDQIFADGTGNAGKDMDGLANGVSQSGTYGGITRDTTVGSPGRALRSGADNSTGGALSLASVNSEFGNCVVGKEKPDLIVTTQTLWNRIWERSQPSEQNRPEDQRDIGFETVRLNSAYVTVDSHCPSGFLYLLNTDWWRFYVHTKWDFRMRGPLEPTNQQLQIGQIILWANLICRSPRLQGVMSGLT